VDAGTYGPTCNLKFIHFWALNLYIVL
jgi:hypothetical protein